MNPREINELHKDNLEQVLHNNESLRVILRDIYKDLSKLDKNYWDFYDIFKGVIFSDMNKFASIQYRKCESGKLYVIDAFENSDFYQLFEIKYKLECTRFFLSFFNEMINFRFLNAELYNLKLEIGGNLIEK